MILALKKSKNLNPIITVDEYDGLILDLMFRKRISEDYRKA